MKTPKILPWLARKAGISDQRAEQLWGDALRHATRTTEWVGTPEYWTVAMDKLNELIDAEVLGDPAWRHEADSLTAPSANTANQSQAEEVLPQGFLGRLCFH
ncbi:MAG: hypothetical protein WBP72_10195 [Rhodocyclaceae bacterium]